MTLLSTLTPYVKYIPLIVPFFLIVYQTLFLFLIGSRRHWRGVGVSLYVSSFSLLAGTVFRTVLTDHRPVDEGLMLVASIVALIGFCLPLVTLLVREDQTGELIFSAGPSWARFIGTVVYCTCISLLIQS